jgi:hypothetical protein
LRFDKLFANFRRVKIIHVGEMQIYCCLLQIVEQHAACINELNDNNRLLFMAEKVLLLLHSLMEEFSVSPILVPNTTEPSSASDACVWMLPTESSNQVESRQIEMVADMLQATLVTTPLYDLNI